MATRRLAGPVAALLALALLLVPSGGADWGPYVSHPGNIPDFHNFTTPQLVPCDSAPFTLEISNRYAEPLENVVVSM